MIPLRDENPTRTFPAVVVLLIVANVVIYLYESVLSDAQEIAFTYTYASIPAVLLGQLTPVEALRVSQPADVYRALAHYNILPQQVSPEWVTVLTSMFLHGSWVHVGGNMLYRWIFGNNIEDLLGHVRFLVFYLVCGVVAAGAQILLSVGSPVPMLGASGAIAGILGAYYLKFPRARILTLVWFFLVYVPASVVLLLWFLLQLAQSVGALGLARTQGGVAVFAHVGGFVAGWVLIRVFGPRRRPYQPSTMWR